MSEIVEAVLSRNRTNFVLDERVRKDGFDPEKIKEELPLSNVLAPSDLSQTVVTNGRSAIPSNPSPVLETKS